MTNVLIFGKGRWRRVARTLAIRAIDVAQECRLRGYRTKLSLA